MFSNDPFDDFFGPEDPYRDEMLLVAAITVCLMILAVVL